MTWSWHEHWQRNRWFSSTRRPCCGWGVRWWTGEGRRNAEEEADAACAVEQLGLRLLEIRYTEPYEGARDHHLHVFEKVSDTPSRFPRRAGVARKRPLGC